MPLIVVASVCLASLFIVFIVIVVISRAKVKRKAERRKRREAAREKRERRERRLAARAIATAAGDQPAEVQGERRPSVASATTVSTGRRSRGRFGSASSMSDSEDDQDGNATPRESRSSNTLRQAKLAAVAAAAADSTIAQQQNVALAASTGRAGKAKKRFGWTSAVHAGAANSAASGGLGTARLGDPRRVWGWKKGLRRRGNRTASEGGTRTRDTVGDDVGTDGIIEAHTTAVELTQTSTHELSSSATATSPVNHVAEVSAGADAQQHAETEATSENSGPLDAPALAAETTQDQVQGPSVSAFPPAYYQAPSAPANAPSSPNGRVTDVGPSARAMEKRAMPAGPEFGEYFPAPTTEEQEQAVDIAYNRNLGLVHCNGDTSTGGSALPSLAGQSNGVEVVPAGSGGHIATDDKQVLERLRMAGSAPTSGGGGGNGVDVSVAVGDAEQPLAPPTTDFHAVNGHHRGVPLQASAPELPVDEDGFERLDDDLLPPDELVAGEHGNMNGAATSSRSGTASAFPLPPAPIAQHSLAYAQPSAPLGMQPSSPLLSSGFAGVPSAPSAPFDILEDEADDARPAGSHGVAATVPSAPPLFDGEETDDANATVPLESTPNNEPSGTGDQASSPLRPSAPPRRFTIPHRTLGIDLPADLAATATSATTAGPITAPPAFSNPESLSPGSLHGNDGNSSPANHVSHVRYLPRYEP